MTLPEWVDPTAPDDPRPATGEEDRPGEAPPVPPDPALDAKPVLEWTKEDWTRWIENSAPTPVPEPERVEDSGGSTADVATDLESAAAGKGDGESSQGVYAVEVDVEHKPAGWPPLPSTDHELRWDEDSDFPIVDIRLPEDDAADPVADSERPWDEPPALAVEAEDFAVDGGAQLADEYERPWDEPPELAAEEGTNGDAYRAGEPSAERAAPFGVAGAPPPFEAASIPSPDRAGPASTELSPPPLVWPPSAAPAPMANVAMAPPGPAIAAPVPAPSRPPVRPVRAEPTDITVERSRRIRSALGLLMVAVTVGIIVAGLVAVSVFAIGVALRRAVG